MKKFIFPSIITIYFVIVFLKTDLQFKKNDLDFILTGLGDVPAEIINSLLAIFGLAVISVLVYVISSQKGGNKE